MSGGGVESDEGATGVGEGAVLGLFVVDGAGAAATVELWPKVSLLFLFLAEDGRLLRLG